MALERVGVGVATEVAKNLLDATKREVSYFFCFNNLVGEHETELGILADKRRHALECAQDAHNRTEQNRVDDQRWLQEAGDLLDESQKLEEERETKRKCFMGWSPNCIWQYRFGKKMAKRKEKATKLIDLSPFKNYKRLISLPNIEYYSSKDFVDLQSRQLTYSKLLEVLEGKQSSTIGLCGMGGSGKTTLVKQVGKQVKESSVFEQVVFVVVSSSPDVKRIQASIADSLGLKFEEQEERAKRLWLRLTNGQRILIILDDVWEKLDFEAIGIPCSESQKGCTVVLTTRSADVCSNMECQSVISLSLLSKEDAWILFQKYANITNESPQRLKEVAKKIAIKCKGLPVAIAIVASTLKKSESILDWKVALESLENSEPLDDIDEDLKEVYRCLKLSYDHLKNEKAQNLFKLCSLFPEDHEIPLEDLTRYGMGLGLFGNVHHKSYEFLRSQARKARKELLDSCLLLQTEEEFVIMHDLVRQVAHWITNGEIQVIMGPEGELKASGDNARFQKSVKFLWFDNMVEFPRQLDCPDLKILIINVEYDEQSLEVKDSFFKEMKDLLVLTLTLKEAWYSGCKQISIPQSIQVLKNLRTLHLCNWILGDISVLGSLKKLETLEFKGCSIEELPTAMLELKKLRLLSLSYCQVEKNPFVVMGSFLQLEELYFLGNDVSHWEIDSKNVSKFTDDNCQWTRLKRYQIKIGVNVTLYDIVKETKIIRALSVVCFDASTLNGTIKDLMQTAESLHLEEMEGGYRSIVPDLVEDGLNELIELRLKDCLNIECLVDFANGSSPVGTIFPELRKLQLNLMGDLKELCQGHSPSDLFKGLEELDLNTCSQLHSILSVGNLKLCNLKVLKVRDCPLLTSLFTLSIAQSLVLLEELSLVDCWKLKYIIGYNADLTNGENENIVVHKKDDYDREIMLPRLRILQLSILPNYISFFPTNDHPVDQSLQLDNIGLELTASTVQASKYKSSEQQLLAMPIAQCFPRQGLNLCHLRKMVLEFVPTLVSLFTPSTAQTMSLLETLRIFNCEGLKHIITNEEDDSSVSVFPKLKELLVEKCNQLKFILPVSLSCGLAELRTVKVSECAVLKYVLGEYHDNDQNEDDIRIQIELPALEFFDLVRLPIIIGICPQNYSPIWRSLKEITLLECGHQLTLTSITDSCTKESEVVMTNNNNSQSVLNLEWLSVSECLDESIFQFKGVCTKGPHNPLSSRLGYLKLKYLPELWHICNGPVLLSFQNLRELKVWGCGKLVTIFSVCVLRSLPQLGKLDIRKCDQLEHIIEDKEEDQDWLNSSSHKVCFPNLERISIHECSKLQYLFSICNPNELRKLKGLLIREASQLEQVFRRRMGNTEDGDRTLLPALQELALVELPCLGNVCHGLKWQSQIKFYRVVDCPQLLHEYQNAGHPSNFPTEVNHTADSSNHLLLDLNKEPCMEDLLVQEPSFKDLLVREDSNLSQGESLNLGHPSNFPTEFNHTADLISSLNINLKSPMDETNAYSSNQFLLALNNELCIEDSLVQEDCHLLQEASLNLGLSSNFSTEKQESGDEFSEEQESKETFSDEPKYTLDLIPKVNVNLKSPMDEINEDSHLSQGACSLNLEQGSKEAFSKGQRSHEAKEEEEVTVKERNATELSTASAGGKEAHTPAAQNLFVNPKTILTNSEKVTDVATQKTKNEEEQGSREAFSNGQEIHEAKEEGVLTVNERNVIKPSTGSAESKEPQMAVAQTSIGDPKTILTNSEKVTEAASQTTKNEGHPSNFPINTTIELTFELTHQLNDGENINTRVSLMEQGSEEAFSEGHGSHEGIDLNGVENRSSSNVVTFGFSLAGHPSNFLSGITTTESIFELTQQLNDSDNINTRVSRMEDKGSKEAKEEELKVKERKVTDLRPGSTKRKEAHMAIVQTSVVDQGTVLTNSEKVIDAKNEEEENDKEAIKQEEDQKGENVLVGSREAHTTVEQTTAPLIDATSSQSITPVVSMETKNAIHQNKIKLPSETVLNYLMEGKDTASITSTCDVLNKANEIALYLPKPRDSLEKDSKSEDDSNHVNYEVGYSGGAPVELPVEEYGAFRDIGAIKKRHIPLLEQAIANHPSLWASSQKVKLPQMKQCGYTILGDLLEFLASTRWSDLNEAKKAEFESLVNGLEILSFDVHWLASTQSKIDKDTINHIKSLEVQVKSVEMQVKSKESIVEYLEVSLQDAKAELHKMKLELDTLRTKLGNINDFIGF